MAIALAAFTGTGLTDIGQAGLLQAENIQQTDTGPAMGSPIQEKLEELQQRFDESLKSFVWDFSRSADTNYDGWPDDWQRRTGNRYPQYVKIAIEAHDLKVMRETRDVDATVMRFWPSIRKWFPSLPVLPPSLADLLCDRYLRIELDGGLAMVQSQKVPTSRMYQYRFSADIMTSGLRHDTARAELVFVDEQGMELESHSTPIVRGSSGWKEYAVNNLRAPRLAKYMFVRVSVEGGEDGLEDIRGFIGFDNLRVEPFPQLQLVTDRPLGIYDYGSGVTATAVVLGLPKGASRVRFHLFDADKNEMASEASSIRSLVQSTPIPSNISVSSEPSESRSATTDMRFDWKMPRLSPGFYTVKAVIEGTGVDELESQTTLAVIEPLVEKRGFGCFGWTLPYQNQRDTARTALDPSAIQTQGQHSTIGIPQDDGTIPPRDFVNWLLQIGVDWVKYPAWIAPDDEVRASQIADLFTRLQDSKIQTVGLLDRPPEDQFANYDLRSQREIVASELFRDFEVWQPLLEPVMSRLTLKVRKWQLGADDDFSFLGRTRLQESVKSIATGLQGYGQPLDITINWPWNEPTLSSQQRSWKAVCRSIQPALTAEELDAYLSLDPESRRHVDAKTWILLNPLPKGRYDRDTRILDLIQRMATVRKHRVEAAFVSNPHDSETGLLTSDSRPDEMLLPWRTTAQLIGDLRQMGSLKMRSRANSIIFAGETRAVLMVWADNPTEELIYLGEDVYAIDVWGKTSELPLENYENRQVQRVKIGKLPTFLVDVDPDLLAFRMSVELKQTQLDSILGQTQPLELKFKNPVRDGLAGNVRIRSPMSWKFEQPSLNWELIGGRDTTEPFNVVLDNSAKVGRYELALDFELQTIPPKRFTVYREINVGPHGLELKATTDILEGGQLKVEVEMQNHSEKPLLYDCMVFPQSGRQYQRRFISVEPGETVRRDFYWSDGAELIGTTLLLRAGEQDGHRILNYEIPVRRQ
ncbi:hypothetical protein [Novipirellula aureliae]|uniref:hypothetical protein n=1 Tax=Novipirellula aureliae TaxID=2527966 RepID=UPI0011B3D89B|nr:hypothetical protein [Novipirellula aureliae]